MENPKQPAFPEPITLDGHSGNGLKGFSKREYLAAMAMSGILSNSEHVQDDRSYPENVAEISVQYADALLKALEK